MIATPETKMKTKEERKQAAWAEYQKIAAAAWDAYKKKVKKILVPALDAYKKKVKEIDDE